MTDARDTGRWTRPEGLGLAVTAVALIFGGHYLYGGLFIHTTMGLTAAAGLALIGVLLHPQLRRDLITRRDLTLPGLLFGLSWAICAWMLTPFIPGGPHPVWAYLGQPPAGTIDRSGTTTELISLAGLACAFLIGAASGASDRRARTAMTLMLTAGLAFGLWAAVVYATGVENLSTNRRLEAHFMSANTAATLFGVLLVLCLGQALRRGGESREARTTGAAIWSGAAVAFAAFLLLTASRGGLVATLGAVVVFLGLLLISGRVRPGRAGLIALAGAAGLLALLLFGGDRVLHRFLEAGRDASWRSAMLATHWQAFLDSPLFGYGLQSFANVNRALITEANVGVLGETRMLHNVYLTWLEEAGLVGALPMFLCIGVIMWRTLRGALRRSRMTSLLFALLAADAVFLLHGITDFALQTLSMSMMFAWLLGFQLALSKGTRG